MVRDSGRCGSPNFARDGSCTSRSSSTATRRPSAAPEAYTARLCEYLARARRRRARLDDDGGGTGGDFWSQGNRGSRSEVADAVRRSGIGAVSRDPPLSPSPLPRPALRPEGALAHPASARWQCLTRRATRSAPAMWRDAGRYDGPLDAVHATAFPYSFPIALRPAAGPAARRAVLPHAVPAPRRPGRSARPHPPPVHRPASALAAAAGRRRVRADADRNATPWSTLGVPESAFICKGWASIPANAPAATRDAARAAWGIRAGEVVVGHLANNSIEKGTVDLLARGGTGLGERGAVPRRPRRAGDAELPRLLGRASRPKNASSGSAC